jgi:tetratricopeptide (TPR) repeat protein
MRFKTNLLIFLVLLITTSIFYAQNPGRDPVAEQKIENQLYLQDSSLVKVFREATAAMDNGNFKLSDSLYSIIYLKLPNFDPVLRRLGSVRTENGKIIEGIELCQKAVSINRSAYNLLSLAYCYLTPGKVQNLDKALGLLKEAQILTEGDDIDIVALIGQIQYQEGNISEFRAITSSLQKGHPDMMITHYFTALLAAQDKQWETAEKEIQKAKTLGLTDDAVQSFLDSGVKSQLTKRKYIGYLIWITSIWAIGLLLLYIIGKILSVLTLNSIEKGLLNEERGTKSFIRSSYKLLINIGGIYYYLSLPIILVLVILFVAGVFYLFLLIGQIPIKLMLLLVVGSGFTIYGMIRSLLIKVKYTDPGRELKTEEAPGLFNLTKEVADKLGTRPIDEIRITLGTDLAVYERGTWKQKLQDRATRILILGAGVIKDFKQEDFKAVLAHEYGHFSHRDTAGGDVALRVRNDIVKYFYALYEAGQNVWWNLAFHFLRLYNFIFRRISFGSTRLQEVLADRVAAQTYGVIAFKNGLTYVIKRDIEFNNLAKQEFEALKNATRSFNNIYDQSRISDNAIENELNDVLNRKTTEDDTHPSPVDRFRYISDVEYQITTDNSSVISDLFSNWDSFTAEMANAIEKQFIKKL